MRGDDVERENVYTHKEVRPLSIPPQIRLEDPWMKSRRDHTLGGVPFVELIG